MSYGTMLQRLVEIAAARTGMFTVAGDEVTA
jgi:hypothetical protein